MNLKIARDMNGNKITSVLTKHQKRSLTKKYTVNGGRRTINLAIRYDDECGNKHNTFAMTATIHRGHGCYTERNLEMGGSCHDEIAKQFPDLAKYIKWHGVSSDSPLHYVANTTYHASDKDCWGLRKGEPRSFQNYISFKGFPITMKISKELREHIEKGRSLVITGIECPRGKYEPRYTFQELASTHTGCPFDSRAQAYQWQQAILNNAPTFSQFPVSWGEGKEPNLEAARSCAIWPDATLEQLRDKKALESRLPALMEEFRSDMEELGFVY